ncbi:hypothetical protein SBOR_2307 [Sclerotinia borealis F-4128]|uniref:Opioid growth factor receptor (OGFr) conserved domain-containing protein n=1 Tax=Sclerotinia borealis (strain F-4128) TaxID=1432307 RepID=W9CRX6_SCLBF|nr:hypothetical protein SBOR_2307 [Sclerotinia borealis F-4128]
MTGVAAGFVHFLDRPNYEGRLVSFYRNKKPDGAGRFISEILEWNHQKLEDTHDYIQWLFPLPEESMVSKAPLVNATTFSMFHCYPDLRSRLKDSFVKMLDFYGFNIADDVNENNENSTPIIIKSPNFDVRCKNWLVMTDHNHLRISRILRSLRILGLEAEAAAFHDALSDIIYSNRRQIVSSRSVEFWRRAAQRPLHWAPHLSEDACLADNQADKNSKVGPNYLRDYEGYKLARAKQQRHDKKKALEEQKEAEFQATKAHIAALNAERKIEVGEPSPQPRISYSRMNTDLISVFHLDNKESAVADVREFSPDMGGGLRRS